MLAAKLYKSANMNRLLLEYIRQTPILTNNKAV